MDYCLRLHGDRVCSLEDRIVGDCEGRGEMDGWSGTAAIDSRKNRMSFTRHDGSVSSYHRTFVVVELRIAFEMDDKVKLVSITHDSGVGVAIPLMSTVE